MQDFRRARKVLQLTNGTKIFQLSKLHRALPPYSFMIALPFCFLRAPLSIIWLRGMLRRMFALPAQDARAAESCHYPYLIIALGYNPQKESCIHDFSAKNCL